MVRSFLMIILLSLFANSAFCEDELQLKIAELDFQSIELIGLPIVELNELLGLHLGGYFTPLEQLQEGGTLGRLKTLEKKGYVSIKKVTKEMMRGLPIEENLRNISLSSKGEKIVQAFEEYQYNKLKN